MSRKSERLVNLTIALLATKRWITKSEIFGTIDGYDGEADAKERMFERDKKDLRNLGIDIEVGTFDPLFEDEAGYRIRSENYRLNFDLLTSREFSLISMAIQSWRGAVLGSSALSALVKLKSLGIDSDLDAIGTNVPHIKISDSNFAAVIDAIAERRIISFTYLGPELEEQSRVIEPYGAGTRAGRWYVAGRDLDRRDLRLFRMDRIDSEVHPQGKADSYAIPADFHMHTMLDFHSQNLNAVIRVRRDKAHSLRTQSQLISEDDEWSTLNYPYLYEADLVRAVLWHLDDAYIIEPPSAVVAIQTALNEIVKLHG